MTVFETYKVLHIMKFLMGMMQPARKLSRFLFYVVLTDNEEIFSEILEKWNGITENNDR